MRRKSQDEKKSKKIQKGTHAQRSQTGRLLTRMILTEQWERKLLVWLLHFPMQRIEDLVHGLGKDASESIIQRVIQGLTDQGLVELVTPSLNVSKKHGWYHLSNKGVYAVARQEGGDPVKMARAWGADEKSLLALLPRFHMLVTLQNIVNDLATLAPEDFSHLDLPLPLVGGARAHIKWLWVRDYETTFQGKRRKVMRCEADAAVVLHRQAGEDLRQQFPEEEFYTLFVFMDLARVGFTDYATMYQKMRNLLLYRESEEWRPYHRQFPLVMVLTGSARQKSLWQLASHEAAKNLHLGMPLSAIVVDLAAEQAVIDERYASRPTSEKAYSRDEYDKVWVYDWRHLVTDEPCRLRDMLSPVVEEAIPPGIIPDGEDIGVVEHTKGQMLVKGRYKERSEHIPHERATKVKERELAFLLGIKISPRFRDILLMVYANPLIEVQELAIFLDLTPVTAKRYLYFLRSWGCIESIVLKKKQAEKSQHKKEGENREEAKEELRWRLSERGLFHLAASEHVSASHVMKTLWPKEVKGTRRKGKGQSDHEGSLTTDANASNAASFSENGSVTKREKRKPLGVWQPGGYILQKNLQHTAGVYHLVAAFHKAATSCPELSIAWFETGIRCSRRYQTKEAKKQIKWHNFRPDAALEYSVYDDRDHTRRRFVAWLEWDEGTMAAESLKEKMQSYAHYMRSRGWRREGQGVIPILVIVVPERGQFDRMTRVAQEQLTDTDLRVCITMQDLMEAHGLLGEIWSMAVPSPLEKRTKLCAFLKIHDEGEI